MPQDTLSPRERRTSDQGPDRYFCDVWDVDLTDDHETDFTAAVESALWLDPKEGRTGTLAAKRSVVLITHQRMDHEAAEQLAEKLIDEDDPRIRDPHGPAGAIPITVDYLGVTSNAWIFFGWARK